MEAILRFCFHMGRYDALFFIPDNGRFVNHSPQPNAGIRRDSDGRPYSVALRDISAGEELFEDYTTYEKCPWANLYGDLGQALGFSQSVGPQPNIPSSGSPVS